MSNWDQMGKSLETKTHFLLGVAPFVRRILVRCRRISLEELRDNYDSELVNRQGGASVTSNPFGKTHREQAMNILGGF